MIITKANCEAFATLDGLIESLPAYNVSVASRRDVEKDIVEVKVFFLRRNTAKGKRVRSPYAKIYFVHQGAAGYVQ
jgi:hypothetical protein